MQMDDGGQVTIVRFQSRVQQRLATLLSDGPAIWIIIETASDVARRVKMF